MVEKNFFQQREIRLDLQVVSGYTLAQTVCTINTDSALTRFVNIMAILQSDAGPTARFPKNAEKGKNIESLSNSIAVICPVKSDTAPPDRGPRRHLYERDLRIKIFQPLNSAGYGKCPLLSL